MTRNTAMGDINSKVFHSSDDNLETFSLVWLDVKVNTTEDNRQTQQRLRHIINHIKMFDNQQQCHQYILSLSAQDRLILIVSGEVGRQLLPQIHQLRQLSSIYVYCMDKSANEQWAKQFTKVKGVLNRLDDLINQIKRDQKRRVKLEEPLSVKIYTGNSNQDQSTTGLNGHFVQSLLLIDVLIRVRPNETDKHELISLCKNEYENCSTQQAVVHEFENEYSSDKALWWYTRDSFLYKMLNKALRVQNIDLLYLFRFVINDIYQQLKRNQCPSPVVVYRTQVIGTDELNILRRSIGQFISTTSFFSTSRVRQNALIFLNIEDLSNDLCRVLFIINADPRMAKSKPFADISLFSDLRNESEVLFMIGCVFRLLDVRYDNNDQIWMIRMELCDDDGHDLKQLFNHLKKEYGCGNHEVNLGSFGDVLHQMGKYDLAEKMYNRLIVQLPQNDPSMCNLCYSLGSLSKDRNEFDYSLQWFQKSLEIKKRTDPSNHIEIGDLYCCIGNVYLKKNNDHQAIECYNKAAELYNRVHAVNHPHMAAVYHGIGDIRYYQKKYSEALAYYEKSLDIQEKCLPSNHPDIAINLDSIGVLYRHLGHYDLAIGYLNRSLEIRLKSRLPQHPDIATSYKNIGLIYERKQEWKQALINYEKAAIIYSHSLSIQHPNVIEIKKYIQRVFPQLH